MEMDHARRQELIECYAAGYDIVAEALDGITDAELDAHGADGWTARQVVHHL